jgi:hypothetical protein
MSPDDAVAAAAARSGDTPSACKRSAMAVAANGQTSMRTQRLAIVTNSGTTSVARSTNTVDPGGSSMSLSR